MKSQGRTKGKTPTINFALAGIVATISDALDFTGLGEIPGLSEVEDIVSTAILYKLLGPIALVSVTEIVLGITEVYEPVPTQLLTVLIAYLKNR